MSQVLLVDLPADEESSVDWLLWDREAGRKVNGGSLSRLAQLSELQAYSKQVPTYAVVPGELVSLFQVSMPTTGAAAVAALPYQVEELLCTGLEDQHIAHEKISADKPVSVAVVRKGLMEFWQQALQGAGLRVRAMVPDYLLLPGRALLLDSERAVASNDRCRATLDTSTLAQWWQLSESDGGETDNLQLLSCVDEPTWLPAGAGAVQRCSSRLQGLADALQEPAFNLLQGAYRLRDPLRDNLNIWRAPAMIAVAVLCLHWLTLGAQQWQSNRELAVLDAAIVDSYREAFPNARRVVNPRSQMRSQLMALQRSGASSQLLPWLEKLSTVLKQQANVEVTQLNFQQQTPSLKVVLTVPSYSSIDDISQALVATGVSVERGSFSQKAGVISGQLIIREAR